MILMLLLYASLTLDQRIFQPIYIQWDCCIFSLAFVLNSHPRSQASQAGKKGVQLLLYKSPCFVFHYYNYCEHTVLKVHLLFKN